MSTLVPPLFVGLVDDAAAFPPGGASDPRAMAFADVLAGHRAHRAAWYADLVGHLLVPVSAVAAAGDLFAAGDRPPAALIADTGVDALAPAVAGTPGLRQVEAPVAKRGEDPQPCLRQLIGLAAGWPRLRVYAEVPLSWGLLAALDTLAEARRAGTDVAAKFRTGGLAAELFPTPVELAAVICACRDRELPFKLTAGLHHAVRHADPETGFTHHGFLNVLVATVVADEGGEVAEVAEVLAATHPVPLIEPARARRDRRRPLWAGFGSCSVVEPLADLVRLGLINGGFE